MDTTWLRYELTRNRHNQENKPTILLGVKRLGHEVDFWLNTTDSLYSTHPHNQDEHTANSLDIRPPPHPCVVDSFVNYGQLGPKPTRPMPTRPT